MAEIIPAVPLTTSSSFRDPWLPSCAACASMEVGFSMSSGGGLLAAGDKLLSLMLCTPKLFSSVRKKVIPLAWDPPVVPRPCPEPLIRRPGDGDRDEVDDGRDLEALTADAKDSSRGRICNKCSDGGCWDGC